MKAYFDSQTGECIAVHDQPERAPQGAVEVPLQPDSDDARRMSNEMRRFRMVVIDGKQKVEEQSGWNPLDLVPHARWFAVKRLDAAYAAKMAEPYLDTGIPLTYGESLAKLLPLAEERVKAEKGDKTAWKNGEISLTWGQVATHAKGFGDKIAETIEWYYDKLAEIQASDDPGSVEL